MSVAIRSAWMNSRAVDESRPRVELEGHLNAQRTRELIDNELVPGPDQASA
jgi:hypothetical protein